MDSNQIVPWYKSKVVWTGIIALVLGAVSFLTGVGTTFTNEDVAFIVEAVFAVIGTITVTTDRIIQHKKETGD